MSFAYIELLGERRYAEAGYDHGARKPTYKLVLEVNSFRDFDWASLPDDDHDWFFNGRMVRIIVETVDGMFHTTTLGQLRAYGL